MPRPRLLLAAALLLPLAVSCGRNPNPPAAGPTRYDRSRISPDEIADARARNLSNVHELVAALRPQWLRQAGSLSGGSSGQVVVYLDNVRQGGIEALRAFTLPAVQSVRWLSPSEAGGMFGLNVNGGVIQILTIGAR